MSKNTFTVIDVKTGEYPDLEAIALHEDWAKGLVYCDMEGFAIEEDGTLLLMDECDNSRYCPVGRFEIVWDEDTDKQEENEAVFKPHYVDIYGKNFVCGVECSACHKEISSTYKFCPYCGRALKWEEGAVTEYACR